MAVTSNTGERSQAEPERSVWRRLPSLSFYQLLFSLYLVVALGLFAFLVPPFQKADEAAHFYRSVSLTNLDLLCSKDENGDYYFSMKRKYADLPGILHYRDLSHQPDVRFNPDWLRFDASDPALDETARVYRFCSLPVVGYVPNAAGVLLGKPFENPLVSFYLGRVAGALFFVGALLLALRITPERYRLIVYVYAALPMVLHQATAFSYDVAQLSLFPLLFAYLARFIVDQKPVSPKSLLIFMGLLWCLVNVRLIAYTPILLLFFVLRPAWISLRQRSYLAVASGFFLFTAVTTGLAALIYLPTSAGLYPDNLDVDAMRQVKYLLGHPLDFLAASYETLQVQGRWLVEQAIGTFGWVEYTMGFVPYFAFVAIGVVSLYYVADQDEPLLTRVQLLALAGAVLLTVAALFMSLYAIWSPVGSTIVDGLQGRYFLGLLPFAMLAVSQLAAMVGKQRLLQVLIVGVGLVIVWNIYRAIDLRYYA